MVVVVLLAAMAAVFLATGLVVVAYGLAFGFVVVGLVWLLLRRRRAR
jgi:hypothetical protein